jgi:hypothetical protein
MDKLLKEDDVEAENDETDVDDDDDDDPYDEDLRFSLDIYNHDRVQIMNEALDQVREVLGRLDVAEQYYASGKMFRLDHPSVARADFQARVKCLCMWYNLTMQLRSKIDVLGNLLLGMGAARRNVPWPTWFHTAGDNALAIGAPSGHFSDESGLTSPLSTSQNFPGGVMARETSVQDMKQALTAAAQQQQCKVRFKLSEDEANSTNPSDSNNSTSTDSGNPKSTTASASASTNTAAASPPPFVAGRQGRRLSLNLSTNLETSKSSVSFFNYVGIRQFQPCSNLINSIFFFRAVLKHERYEQQRNYCG